MGILDVSTIKLASIGSVGMQLEVWVVTEGGCWRGNDRLGIMGCQCGWVIVCARACPTAAGMGGYTFHSATSIGLGKDDDKGTGPPHALQPRRTSLIPIARKHYTHSLQEEGADFPKTQDVANWQGTIGRGGGTTLRTQPRSG